MQTISHSDFVVGIFKKELKNRFLCEVNIDGEDVVCYVPSSCHLSNFLKLEGKKVLLIPTQTQNTRTKYALFAVPYKKNYIILNTSMANRAIEASIKSRRFCYLGNRSCIIKERSVDGYKADLFIPESNTIVEVKSIISLNDNAIFPTVYSERTLKQLDLILNMLKKGYKVCFILVSLHPYVKSIRIDTNSEFYTELDKCMKAGLVLKAYTCRLQSDAILIDKEINITY